MLESLVYKQNPLFTSTKSTSVAMGVLVALSFPPSLEHNLFIRREYQYKTANKYSWEQELRDFTFAFPVRSVMPSELIDQPSYSYGEMIELSKRLGLPTEFSI